MSIAERMMENRPLAPAYIVLYRMADVFFAARVMRCRGKGYKIPDKKL